MKIVKKIIKKNYKKKIIFFFFRYFIKYSPKFSKNKKNGSNNRLTKANFNKLHQKNKLSNKLPIQL